HLDSCPTRRSSDLGVHVTGEGDGAVRRAVENGLGAVSGTSEGGVGSGSGRPHRITGGSPRHLHTGLRTALLLSGRLHTGTDRDVPGGRTALDPVRRSGELRTALCLSGTGHFAGSKRAVDHGGA